MFNNKKEFEAFRKDVEEALAQVAEKYNADITAGNIKYNDNDLMLQVKANKREVNGVSFEKVEFEKHCELFGLKPTDYNKEVIIQGKKRNIVGFDLKARKTPVRIIDAEGNRYKITEELAQRLCKDESQAKKVKLSPSDIAITKEVTELKGKEINTVYGSCKVIGLEEKGDKTFIALKEICGGEDYIIELDGWRDLLA